ncbi:MAG: DMT family transporter [Rhodospirillaceae bacterium]
MLNLSATARGALWMMGSTASWCGMAAITRHFTGEIHTYEIVFFRSIFGSIFLFPWLLKVGMAGLKTRRVGMHILRGFTGLAIIYLLFTAIQLAPLGEVAAIISSRPVFASLLAILILKEASKGRRWVSVILGFMGALIIIRPGFSTVSNGVVLALTAAMAMAFLSIILKSLARTEKPDTIVIWQMVIFTPCSLLPALFVWVTPDWEQFLLLAGVGLFGTATQRCLTRAYAAADTTVVVPFDFSRLIFAAIIGFLLFQEFPDVWTWIGGTIISLAILWMARGESPSKN